MIKLNKIEILKNYIKESNSIVFFGGAGTSTESGIKDFRSKDGLYNEKYKYPPEQILSHTFYKKNTQEFYKFYKEKLNCLTNKPNPCHYYLTKLENQNKLTAIITQNIDGLHQKANSKNIIELHGTIYENYCTKCNKYYNASYIFNSKDIPTCSCGGIIKPKVVLYEESLDETAIKKTIHYISNCELLIIAGTSLTVYPASSFIKYFQGKHLVIINKQTTTLDKIADLIINENIGYVFSQLDKI